MERLFSYGTLRQSDVQLATFGRLLDGTSDTLVGYRLGEIEITDPDVIAKSGKRFHPMLIRTNNANDRVDGVIFEISDDELACADRYEVDDYKRILATFLSGNTAWIYGDANDKSAPKQPITQNI